MRILICPIMVLLLVVLHAPTQAQALLFDFLPADFRPLNTSEPITLLLTGVALLGLARVGLPTSRGMNERPSDHDTSADADTAARRSSRSKKKRAA